jgi:hypothetical protein
MLSFQSIMGAIEKRWLSMAPSGNATGFGKEYAIGSSLLDMRGHRWH